MTNPASGSRSPLRHPLIGGATVGLLYGILARYVAETHAVEPFFGVMTVAFLFVVPVVLGYLTVRFHPRPSWAYRLVAPWLPIAAMVLVCWLVGWEGSICIVMGLPLLLILSTLGGILGGWSLLRGKGLSMVAAMLPFVIAPLEHRVPVTTRVHRLETVIPIQAPPAAVWAQVVEVPTIRREEQRPALYTQLGFPRPLNATLSHHGVGGRRYARFERGVLFIETITRWEVDRRLRFDIEAQTDSIPSTTLDRHVTIGGPYFDVLSGEYTIEPRRDGTVLLHLASELRVSTHFNLYARPWVDAIMRSIQVEILEVVRARAEGRVARGSAAHPLISLTTTSPSNPTPEIPSAARAGSGTACTGSPAGPGTPNASRNCSTAHHSAASQASPSASSSSL
jgi:hypothetical protein